MDTLIRGNSTDGSIRVFSAITTDTVNEAHRIHKTSATASAALGRLLTAAAIMGAQLKSDTDSVTLQINGEGPLGIMIAVTDNKSHVRGYAANPQADLPTNAKGKLDVGGAVGPGFLSVIRDLGLKEPYIGRTPLISGEIAEDLTYYYVKSEQIPTAVALGVLVDTDLSIKAAGGYMIQLMPEATEETAERLTEIVENAPSVTDMITSGMSAEDIAFAVTSGFDMLLENNAAQPMYECKCSRERMERALISIGKQELRDIIEEQGEAEMSCQFCDKLYHFTREELEALCEKAK
ncbi:MAG TPA: Hsp33 family molecular chaperone HslO [Candidatus Ornithomonoglobus merdipullorum]|uniref:33 kDa chaperonin n=1 Tax=Candidatus Ornithomonoglobus merdipullorum TaxID=2840895 RepID=A0A9D1MAS6_9FIRM|nr:Hsp33 family molecular chaperone HslO [Candidatus Ornithomonoglobus merdipullorum]